MTACKALLLTYLFGSSENKCFLISGYCIATTCTSITGRVLYSLISTSIGIVWQRLLYSFRLIAFPTVTLYPEPLGLPRTFLVISRRWLHTYWAIETCGILFWIFVSTLFIVFNFGFKIPSSALLLTRHSAIGWLKGQGLEIV